MATLNDKLPPDDKLMMARARLMVRAPFYGHLAMMIDWVKSNMEWAPEWGRTMGVRVKSNRRIELIWNPDFVASQTMHELFGAIQHELEHIVHLHMVRRGGRDAHDWNIAADMTVNGTKTSPIIGYDEDSGVHTLPIGGNIIFRPGDNDWGNLTTEQLYKRVNESIDKSRVCPTCNGTGKAGKDSQPCPTCGGSGTLTKWGRIFDDHSSWNQTDVSADEARQIVKEIVREVIDKGHGNVPGHLIDAIDALVKAQVRWQDELKAFVGKYAHGRRSTWNRVNRRHDAFGIKGYSGHAVADGAIIMDTSGSIGKHEMAQFWGEIESMMSRLTFCVLQWDSGFQDFWPRYRRYDWKKIKIKGGGGTDMAAPIDWLIKNGKIPRKGPVVMMTDGHANFHEPCSFPYIALITEPTGSEPKWGRVIHLKDKNGN